MIDMIKNHKTTTLLVAIAAIAATLLATGSVTVASNHPAFAWKDKEYKKDKYQRDENKYQNDGSENSGTSNSLAQSVEQNCQTAGGTSPITASCTAAITGTITNSGGNTMACTTITIPPTTINVTSASGGPPVPVELHKPETLPCDIGKSILLTIGIGTPGIDVFVTFTPRPSTGVCPENSVPAVGNNGAPFCASFETGM